MWAHILFRLYNAIHEKNGPFCPVDKGSISESQIFPDNCIKKEIFSCDVFCRFNKSFGCPWKGPLNDLKEHLNRCDYVKRECINGCGTQISKLESTRHLNRECPKRLIHCDHCASSVEYQELNEHNRNCSKYPLSCANCGESGIPRDRLNEHLEKICLRTEIDCPFNAFGCSYEAFRSEVTEHVKDNLVDHLNGAIKQQQSQYQDMKNIIRKLCRRVSDLEWRCYDIVTSYDWQICDVESNRSKALSGERYGKFSPGFYTRGETGYKFCVRFDFNGDLNTPDSFGNYVSISLYMMKGEFDHRLRWPLMGKVKFCILNQSQTDPSDDLWEVMSTRNKSTAFHRPKGDMNGGYGYPNFAPVKTVFSAPYLKDDTLKIRVLISLLPDYTY